LNKLFVDAELIEKVRLTEKKNLREMPKNFETPVGPAFPRPCPSTAQTISAGRPEGVRAIEGLAKRRWRCLLLLSGWQILTPDLDNKFTRRITLIRPSYSCHGLISAEKSLDTAAGMKQVG
jgi:hypothetical protein